MALKKRSLKHMEKHGEWIIDHIYDLPTRTRVDIFYDLGGWFCEEDETELEKGDMEYEQRYE